MGGSNVIDQPGTYGSEGTPAPGNVPGARESATTWTDTAGNFWLFGGGSFNDLWEYSAGQWTWISGSNVAGQKGVYGTEGMASSSNVPGARNTAVGWTDTAGNLWLFGGYGLDANGSAGWLNDLWKYSAGQWTWMGGSSVVNQPGVYGTKGTAAAGNVPGARADAIGWTDTAGNLWLFGGYNDFGMVYLNDFWKYSAGQWTWMGGSNVSNQHGTYGTEGVSALGNVPGARRQAVAWTDTVGNFWLFGGEGYSLSSFGDLNDLWKYSAGQWTWMNGSNMTDESGTYGIEGVPAAGNVPGARVSAISWTDAGGNLWLFGGNGSDANGNGGWLNDLWRYSAGQWTWMSGPDVLGYAGELSYQLGSYGMLGTTSPANIPGGRWYAVGWTDTEGNLWLFGGQGWASVGPLDMLNDLWKYEP